MRAGGQELAGSWLRNLHSSLCSCHPPVSETGLIHVANSGFWGSKRRKHPMPSESQVCLHHIWYHSRSMVIQMGRMEKPTVPSGGEGGPRVILS